jgi:short-subunit dehydrogenase
VSPRDKGESPARSGSRPYEGRWALVTGASSGLGEAFAVELAARGANVALAARRTDRLAALAARLGDSHGTRTLTVAADLGQASAPAEIMDALQCEGVAVDFLVNNAGSGLKDRYLDYDWAAHDSYLNLMVRSCAELSWRVLPGMVERRYGRMIQVASVAGLLPGSRGHTLYGACKAFLVSFSQSLAAEYGGQGIKVSALCPGFISTEFHDVAGTREVVARQPRFMFSSPEDVVASGLHALERGQVVHIPGKINKLSTRLLRELPTAWAAKIVAGQAGD